MRNRPDKPALHLQVSCIVKELSFAPHFPLRSRIGFRFSCDPASGSRDPPKKEDQFGWCPPKGRTPRGHRGPLSRAARGSPRSPAAMAGSSSPPARRACRPGSPRRANSRWRWVRRGLRRIDRAWAISSSKLGRAARSRRRPLKKPRTRILRGHAQRLRPRPRIPATPPERPRSPDRTDAAQGGPCGCSAGLLDRRAHPSPAPARFRIPGPALGSAGKA
jgi:hypothetical protein